VLGGRRAGGGGGKVAQQFGGASARHASLRRAVCLVRCQQQSSKGSWRPRPATWRSRAVAAQLGFPCVSALTASDQQVQQALCFTHLG